MRITIAPTGEMVVDTDDTAAAAALIRALRNGAAPAKPKPKPKHAVPRPVPTPDVELGQKLTDTWNWLVAAQAEVTTQQVAQGVGITVHTATNRLNQLIEKGLAHRVRRGVYLPGEEPRSSTRFVHVPPPPEGFSG